MATDEAMGKLSSIELKTPAIDIRVGSKPGTERITGWQLVKIRKRIMLRDGYKCQVCGRVTVDGEVDHLQPLHLGGRESDANRQWICREPCHRLKTEEEMRSVNGVNDGMS